MNEVAKRFNRTCLEFFSWKRWLIYSAVLISCSFLHLFFLGISAGQSFWIRQVSGSASLLINAWILLALQLISSKLYQISQEKDIKVSVSYLVKALFPSFGKLSVLLLPAFLLYLILLLISGLFMLLTLIPWLGTVISTVFACIPFLIMTSFFCLALFLIFLSLYVVPLLGKSAENLRERLKKQTMRPPFDHLLFVGLPLVLMGGYSYVLITVANASMATFLVGGAERLVQWLSVSVAFSFMLAPALVFWNLYCAALVEETH